MVGSSFDYEIILNDVEQPAYDPSLGHRGGGPEAAPATVTLVVHTGPTLVVNSIASHQPPRYQEQSRSSGAAWLNQGYQQPYDQQYTNWHHGQGYYQQPNYKHDPRRSSVEYVQGYHVPYERWIRHADGTWLDLVPQSPEESIFFHQPTWQRRQNELYLYGYTFRMGLWDLWELTDHRQKQSPLRHFWKHIEPLSQPAVASSFCQRACFTAGHKLSASYASLKSFAACSDTKKMNVCFVT